MFYKAPLSTDSSKEIRRSEAIMASHDLGGHDSTVFCILPLIPHLIPRARIPFFLSEQEQHTIPISFKLQDIRRNFLIKPGIDNLFLDIGTAPSRESGWHAIVYGVVGINCRNAASNPGTNL